MSDKRRPCERWKLQTIAAYEDKKEQTVVELFPARMFADKWEPGSKDFIKGKPAMHNQKRKEFWEGDNYRVRVNGSWLSPKARYQFFSKQELFRRVFE